MLAAAAQTTPLVTALSERRDRSDWYWWVRSPELGENYAFLAAPDMARALMRIDGSEIELRLVTSRGYPGKVGDVLEATFQSEDLVVKTRFVVTATCSPNKDDCENLDFSATIEVARGARSQIVRGVGNAG
jgi:hypothetical protein